MNCNEALSKLNDIHKSLLENEVLCKKSLLQKDELNAKYKSLPKELKVLISPLNDLSHRIYTKYLQKHNTNTKWEHQDLTNIARVSDYESYIKPWIFCIQEILDEYNNKSEFQQLLDDGSFNWLDSYPRIKSDIQNIQKKVNQGEINRGIMDDLRLLVENFMQEFLKNKNILK